MVLIRSIELHIIMNQLNSVTPYTLDPSPSKSHPYAITSEILGAQEINVFDDLY